MSHRLEHEGLGSEAHKIKAARQSPST
jgi:hypothetical protein